MSVISVNTPPPQIGSQPIGAWYDWFNPNYWVERGITESLKIVLPYILVGAVGIYLIYRVTKKGT